MEGRTLVPVRAIFEAIGATVEWDNSTRTATGKKDGTIVSIQINNTTAYVNGEARTPDVSLIGNVPILLYLILRNTQKFIVVIKNKQD